jgi:hypothetical protein
MLSQVHRKRIDPDKHYTLAETTVFLKDGGVTTTETIKRYCRTGKLKGKKKGAKKTWHVLGSSIEALREEWDLD